MKLYSVSVRAFRRFDDGWLNVESPATAIVGPNEAGKSSLLRAMTLLNADDPIPATDVSRGRQPGECRIEARFRLTPEERASLGVFYPPTAAIWLKVTKDSPGPRAYELDPPIGRDLRNRRAAAAELIELQGLSWYKRWAPDDERRSVIERSAASLALSNDNLAADELNVIRELAAILWPLADGSVSVPGTATKATIARAGRVLASLQAVIEDDQNAIDVNAGSQLAASVPLFLDFTEPHRSLKSSYNLENEPEYTDVALRAITDAAGLPLSQLRNGIRTGQAGAVKTMLDQASEGFSEFLRENWRQSSLSVLFENQAATLRLFVRADAADVFLLDERSDGLRFFLALVAFVAARRTGVDPILLIDEAETHLHYDAQADLARVLEQQTKAASVVYTTHSIGCLPQDLGRGVRAVRPVEGADRSETVNAWWQSGGGLTPLVLAMGAQAFGFTPARFAVFAEGPSDALLLPTLLREALGVRALPYQVVPGISAASLERLEVMEVETPRVAYLVDGDKGGSDIARRLRTLGVPDSAIIGLGNRGRGKGLQVEDLLAPAVYAMAVNEELRSWPPGTGEVRAADLPKTNRPQYVAKYCKSKGRPVPGKLSVAAEVLKLLEGTSTNTPFVARIGDEELDERLRDIDVQLRSTLKIQATQT